MHKRKIFRVPGCEKADRETNQRENIIASN